MGIHKTVNGAYQYRYASFLTPTYYVKGCSPLALPLGELSPQVTERVLPPWFPSPSSLRSATSPKGRGKGRSHYNTGTGTAVIPLCLLAV